MVGIAASYFVVILGIPAWADGCQKPTTIVVKMTYTLPDVSNLGAHYMECLQQSLNGMVVAQNTETELGEVKLLWIVA